MNECMLGVEEKARDITETVSGTGKLLIFL